MHQAAEDLKLTTTGETQIIDLTDDVNDIVTATPIRTGQTLIHTQSSTSAITTLEHEPGLVEDDIPNALDRLFPRHGDGVDYGHQRRWQDGNGHSHVRAAFIGPDLTAPIQDGSLRLGTWEQIVFIELDNKPRERTVAIHAWGET